MVTLVDNIALIKEAEKNNLKLCIINQSHHHRRMKWRCKVGAAAAAFTRGSNDIFYVMLMYDVCVRLNGVNVRKHVRRVAVRNYCAFVCVWGKREGDGGLNPIGPFINRLRYRAWCRFISLISQLVHFQVLFHAIWAISHAVASSRTKALGSKEEISHMPDVNPRVLFSNRAIILSNEMSKMLRPLRIRFKLIFWLFSYFLHFLFVFVNFVFTPSERQIEPQYGNIFGVFFIHNLRFGQHFSSCFFSCTPQTFLLLFFIDRPPENDVWIIQAIWSISSNAWTHW